MFGDPGKPVARLLEEQAGEQVAENLL